MLRTIDLTDGRWGALGASSQLLPRDVSTLGMVFESLCIRDLRDGRYALFEVKLGAAFVDEGAATLRRLSSKLDTEVMGNPALCAVLVPGGYAYQRDDGVFVLPITCLAP